MENFNFNLGNLHTFKFKLTASFLWKKQKGRTFNRTFCSALLVGGLINYGKTHKYLYISCFLTKNSSLINLLLSVFPYFFYNN